ncbi:MAG TPA: hypothetical protein PKE63_02560 [Lacibacter sp.]|nr:hypothetical protein [Lacibacter sp.]HMO89931.1 hypothetical protein [Lacibacter sp.]HMP86128.1 hypothetical protein [Lacibacter sp.]
MKQILTALLCLSLLADTATAQEWLDKDLIVFYNGRQAIFPAEWKKVKARPARMEFFHSDTAALLRALEMYPPSLIRKHLSRIYVVGSLRWGGQQFYGTNSRRNIYIEGGDSVQTNHTFHHEFSSILLRNLPNGDLKWEWQKRSPRLVNRSSAAAMWLGYSATALNEKLMEDGYLCDYSLSNWENDFNMYAEYIFCGGAAFWKLVDKYPLVKKKVGLVINFYNTQVSHIYRESFFREVAGL